MRPVPIYLVMICLYWVISGCGGEAADHVPAEQPPAAQAASASAGDKAVGEPEPATPTSTAKQESRPPVPSAERVVLIVVDNLRADRLGAYGYRDHPVTPAMDRLAEQGILFENFHAASPWTAPSFGTMLTGVAPTVHRVGWRLHKSAKTGRESMGVRITQLNPQIPTLCELIVDVTCGAIVTNSFLHPAFGFDRGFTTYDHKNASLSRCRPADEVTRTAETWLKEHADQPFFLMVHYFDPHMSYNPPVKYVRQFAAGPRGRIKVPFANHSDARTGKLNPTEREKAFIRGLYNGEVRFVDDQIDVLVNKMNQMGLLENSWLVVTADHGEEQFDHGSFDHGHRYEEEVTRLPLIIRPPGGKWRAGTRIPYSTRHADLVPTILEWLDKPKPAHLSGRSLMPLITGEETAHRVAYMEYNLYWKQRSSLFDGRYKLIRDVEGEKGFMYDLKEDPAEKKRLKAGHPRYGEMDRQLAALRKQLSEIAKSTAATTPGVALPDEVVKSLRSLGYIE